jgi:hypothetical protein
VETIRFAVRQSPHRLRRLCRTQETAISTRSAAVRTASAFQGIRCEIEEAAVGG